MDDYSETEEIFLEEEDEDLYDKFNSLTFLSNTLIENFKFEKQLSTIYVEKCPNESLSNTSIQKSTNYSGDKIEDGTKISIYADSVIKLGIHPLLMLSDIHRRFFPMRHNESLTMGRYDPKTNAIKYLLFDSVIMNHEDKFYAMLEITRPFLFCDNAVTTGSRDFYYWARSYQSKAQPVSRIIQFEDTLSFNDPPSYFSVPVIKFPKSLGCIPISGISFPRLSITLSPGGCASAQKLTSFNKYHTLKEIEKLYKPLITIETIYAVNKSSIPSVLHVILTDSFISISSILYENEAHIFINQILRFNKGRVLLYRLFNILNNAMSHRLLFVILNAMCMNNFTPTQFNEVFFDEPLTAVMCRILSRSDIKHTFDAYDMFLRSNPPIIHTLAGLAIIFPIFLHMSKIWQSERAPKDINIIHQIIKNVTGAIEENHIPHPFINPYKVRLKAIADLLQKTKFNNLDDGPIKLFIHFCDTFPSPR